MNGLQSHDIRCHAERFNGECSHAEINRLMAICKNRAAAAWSGSAVVKPRYREGDRLLPEAAGGGDPDHRLDRCADQRAVGDLHRSGRV
ncbi:hypothetical protein M3O75_21900 [Klebsiella pneumoniae]|nr:hypothetical protein [Klebsiella pneumoniae]